MYSDNLLGFIFHEKKKEVTFLPFFKKSRDHSFIPFHNICIYKAQRALVSEVVRSRP